MKTKYPIFFVRLLFGIIFFWQGYGKLFKWTITEVYESSFKSYESTFLPYFLLNFTAYFTSIGELFFGVLVIFGLLRTYAYYGLAIILLIVSFGHGLQTPLWDLQHVFIRTVFLVFLMLMFDKDKITLDHFLKLN